MYTCIYRYIYIYTYIYICLAYRIDVNQLPVLAYGPETPSQEVNGSLGSTEHTRIDFRIRLWQRKYCKYIQNGGNDK